MGSWFDGRGMIIFHLKSQLRFGSVLLLHKHSTILFIIIHIFLIANDLQVIQSKGYEQTDGHRMEIQQHELNREISWERTHQDKRSSR